MDNDMLKALSQLLDQKLDEKLEPIKVELNGFKEELKGIGRKQDSLEEIVIEIKEGQTNMEAKIDSISEETAKLLEYRESSKLEMNKINEEVQFQAHKINELEKVVFAIQSYLKMAK